MNKDGSHTAPSINVGPQSFHVSTVRLIQHSTFHIQHSTFAFVSPTRFNIEPRIAAKTKRPARQTAAPSQPDVGQGVPTRENAAISRPAVKRRHPRARCAGPGGAGTRGCRRFTAGSARSESMRKRPAFERTRCVGRLATREEESADRTESRRGSAPARSARARRARAR